MGFLGFGNHKYDEQFTGELIYNRQLVRTVSNGTPGTGLWGYLDGNGNIAIETKFDDAFDFDPQTQIAQVFIVKENPRSGGLETGWYYINLKGKVIAKKQMK
jgi:hypothetical protein